MSRRLSYLKKMQECYPDLTVVWHKNNRGKWVYLPIKDKEAQDRIGWKDYPNHYVIPANEIIIDVDTNDDKARQETEELLDKRVSSYTYAKFRNPSGKPHYHLMFNGLDKVGACDRKLLKEIILHKLCRGVIKLGKIDMQLTSKHCVRMPFGEYEKDAMHQEHKELVTVHKLFEFNDIPDEWYKEFKKKVDEITVYITTEDENGNLPCITYFLQEDFKHLADGRQRAMFILASYFKRKGLPDDLAYEKIQAWNQYHLNSYLKPMQIRACIRSNKGLIGCKYRKQLLAELGKLKICEKCSI